MTNRRIVIVGFMGSGKTTVAKALARKLDCEMIDLDSFITEREGRSPAEIIQNESEREFREIETSALTDVLAQGSNPVIALGGGAWTIEKNRELVHQNSCLTVWLDAPFALCWERISQSKNARPLAPNREATMRLFESRRDDYRLASLRIHVDDSDSAAMLANRIVRQT